MRHLAIFAITFLLILVVAQIPQLRSVAGSYFDKRPVRHVLFIGNSLTFVNDVPAMVRHIADSATSPYRYETTMIAEPGRPLREHWQDMRVQEALTKTWDNVIIQSRSGEASSNLGSPDQLADFFTYGALLIKKAKEAGSRTAIYATWRESAAGYGSSWGYNGPDGRPAHLSDQEMQQILAENYNGLQTNFTKLSADNNADLINVGAAWQMAGRMYPQLQLYGPDGHHASPAGSYLAALTIYRYMSGDNALQSVSYVPNGVSAQDATNLIYCATLAPIVVR